MLMKSNNDRRREELSFLPVALPWWTSVHFFLVAQHQTNGGRTVLYLLEHGSSCSYQPSGASREKKPSPPKKNNNILTHHRRDHLLLITY